MTGQVHLDSYADTGVFVSLALVNQLARGGPIPPSRVFPALTRILASDPQSLAQLAPSHTPAFLALARRLRGVFDALDGGDVDTAATRLNDLLAGHSAHPYLAVEGGRWRLHHHPADAALVPMWTAICAEALARMVGAGHAERLGTCERDGCGRVFVDVTRNASRRFCS